MNTTKKRLVASVLAMAMCFTMLIGSTFAWFTDTASTAVNSIQSGTLDVDLVDENGISLVDETLSFKQAGENLLWEPGCTWELQDIYVVNKGNLALEYEIVITGINGNAKLNEAIEWTISNEKGTLLADAENNTALVSITGHMKEEAGNEYMGLTIDGIAITVLAKQTPYEYDSYDNQYDATAEYPQDKWDGTVDTDGLNQNTDDTAKTVDIASAEQFAAFAKSVNEGKTYAGYTVNLVTSVDLAGIDWAPIGATNGETMDSYPSYTFAGTFNGNGLTISNLTAESAGNNAVAGLFGTASRATIKNVVVDGAYIKSEHYAAGILAYETEYTNVIGCTVKNSTIISGTNGTHDNGDKVGGIVGAMTGAKAAYAISGNTVENCTIQGYRDVGGIIGMAADGLKVEDNKVVNTTIIQDSSDDYKVPRPTTFGEIVGRGAPSLKGNKVENTTILFPVIVSNQAELNDAIAANNNATIMLPAGNYKLPTLSNKTIAITGSKNTVMDLTTNIGSTGADITFEGVTVLFDNDGYEGFQHTKNLVYKDCTIIGTQFLYAPTVEFTNCTFEKYNATTEYNVWTYGVNANFTDCTFNSSGKAILVYNEGEMHATVTVENCTFNGDGTYNDKAAIEVGSSAYSADTTYNIVINNSTANGFVANNSTSSLWGNKNSMDQNHLNVVIDGVDVY